MQKDGIPIFVRLVFYTNLLHLHRAAINTFYKIKLSYFREEEASLRNPDRPTSLLELGNFDDNDDFQSKKRVNRISSPEKWEIKQVIFL